MNSNLKNKPKHNTALNFNSKAEKSITLFNCIKCGFHAKVMSKIWVEGNENEFVIRLLEIHPQYEKVVEVIGEKINADGKICEELMCGHCGRVGSRKSVSVELLKVFGLDPNEKYEDEDTEEESVEEKEEKPKGIINKIKSKILKGVKGETD